jgi:hypothetical protein
MQLIVKFKTPSNAQNNESFLLINLILLQYPALCNPKTYNTPFRVFKKCFGTNQLWLDTMKDIVILVLGYSIKHHVLIHVGLHYQKAFVHDQKDGVKLQYLFQNILKMPNG